MKDGYSKLIVNILGKKNKRTTKNDAAELPIVEDGLVPIVSLSESSADTGTQTEDDKQSVIQLKKIIAGIAVHIWRLKKRMAGEDGEPLEEFRRNFRHLQAALDDLTNAQIEIKDFDHQTIPENGVLSLRVLAYQPTSGISSEQVIETVKPAIYYKGEAIQYGEVIVGTPLTEGEAA